MTREDVFAYVLKKYGTVPEYPWAKSPGYAILRHSSGRKWYCAVLNVARRHLGLDGDGSEDIIDVKCDPMLIGDIVGQPGILPGYHMNKEHWITILLDSDIPAADVQNFIDMSYHITAPKKKKHG